jgi:hypothetical protein
LTLQDEHLLTQGEDLAVTIVTEQPGEQGSKGREQHEEQMPEHAGEDARAERRSQQRCWTVGARGIRALRTTEIRFGTSRDKAYAYHACIWRNGVPTDLNKLIAPGLGWNLTEVRAINGNGWIVGVGVRSGQTHGFVLIPN